MLTFVEAGKLSLDRLAKALVECDSDQGGPTSSNYALFPFAKLRRPVYPLDITADFSR